MVGLGRVFVRYDVWQGLGALVHKRFAAYLMAPVLGLMLNLPSNAYWAMLEQFVIGYACAEPLGSGGCALTAAVRSNGLLLSLIDSALYIPVLIFAASAVYSSGIGLSYAASWAF